MKSNLPTMKVKEQSMLAFGAFRRGGSSIGFMVLEHLLVESGLLCKDLVREVFDGGSAELAGRHVLPALRQHDLVGCFRTAPKMSSKSLARARLFLLVRDPRDCQLSWYHARHLHRHEGAESVVLPTAKIHEDLIREDSFAADVTSLLDWCELSGGRIFRYEDMVSNPLSFIMAFAEFSGLPLKRSAIDLALILASFFQPSFDHANHNRSGAPYEALRTLPSQQLNKLNERFAPLLARLGYPLDASALPDFDMAAMVQRDAQKRYVLGLAEQNGLRMRDVAELKLALANVLSEVRQHVPALSNENGMRIVEIAKQKQDLVEARAEIADRFRKLSQESRLTMEEVSCQRNALINAQSEIAQHLRQLPEENGLRIAEIAQLQQGLADLRAEITQIKEKKKSKAYRLLQAIIRPPKSLTWAAARTSRLANP